MLTGGKAATTFGSASQAMLTGEPLAPTLRYARLRRYFIFQSLRRMDGGERICEAGAGDDRLARRAPERRERRRRRGRREPGFVRRGTHRGRSQAALARRSTGSGRARSGREADLRAPTERARDRERHNARPLRRQEQLVRGLRVLVPEDLRPRRRADPRRRSPEVDGRGTR